MPSLPGSALPRYATSRTDRPTFGPAVADVARALGLALMPWQSTVSDVCLEHVDGRFSYREAIVSTPRQSGKSSWLLAMIVWRMLSAPSMRIAYGAQTRLACRSKLLDDWWPRLARSPLGEMFTVSRVNGSESLRSVNGSQLVLLSDTEAAGHGNTIDMAVLDEAWALDHRAEQSVRPAMATKINGQLLLTSTAGTEKSTYWAAKVASGRTVAEASIDTGLAYFEWSAAPGSDMTDPAVWHSCMPAMCPAPPCRCAGPGGRWRHTVNEATISADLMSMDINEFSRAYGNVPASDLLTGWRVISRDDWEAARW